MSPAASVDSIAVVWPTATIQWDRGVWRMVLGFRDHIGPQHGWFLRNALAADPPEHVTEIVLEESAKNSLAVLTISGSTLTEARPAQMREWVDDACRIASASIEEIKRRVPAARAWLNEVSREGRE